MNNKLYNIVFPAWAVWMFFVYPPLIFIVLAANLVIDGLVVLLTLKLNKVKLIKEDLIKLILKAWGFGFVADLFGSILMTIFIEVFDFNGYHAPESLIEVFPFAISIFAAAFLIVFFNYNLAKKLMEKCTAKRFGFIMGIITAPWFFLFPEMFY
ncbi:MAG: hypothetical protein K9L17_12660 [Clostridiales bacterium]|nr:hypothetical protein [Clostridiales bacterium]MCF8023530.1 hypothetical protein [Clostridiales bacterium]